MIGDAPQNDPRSKAARFFRSVTGLDGFPVSHGFLDERIQGIGIMEIVGVRPDGRHEDTVHALTIQMRFRALDWL